MKGTPSIKVSKKKMVHSGNKNISSGEIATIWNMKCGKVFISNGTGINGFKMRARLHAKTCGCNKDDIYGLQDGTPKKTMVEGRAIDTALGASGANDLAIRCFNEYIDDDETMQNEFLKKGGWSMYIVAKMSKTVECARLIERAKGFRMEYDCGWRQIQ